MEQLERSETWLRSNGWDDQLVGIWHSHPTPSERHPSREDTQYFLAVCDLMQQRDSFSAALIFTPDRDGLWGGAQCHGWVTYRQGYSRVPICEPAIVRRR